MEKTKGVLVKMLFNMHKDNFSRSDLDELFSLEDLRSSLSEVLEEDKIFIVDLAIFIEEMNKRSSCPEEISKNDIKMLRTLWDGFHSDYLFNLRQTSSDENIRKVITKMLILKNAYKKLNDELFLIDLEDYFVPRERLLEIVL